MRLVSTGGAPGVHAIIIERYFPPRAHPCQIFQQIVLEHLRPHHTVLEIGCGRTAPDLLKLKVGRAR
jgi:hypothetical protein